LHSCIASATVLSPRRYGLLQWRGGNKHGSGSLEGRVNEERVFLLDF